MDQASTKKMTPGDDMHLTLLMAPHNLNLVAGQDRQHLLAFGRAAFEAGQKCQGCSVPPNGLHQIAEPSHSMSQYASKDDMLKAVMAENEQLKALLAAAQQGVPVATRYRFIISGRPHEWRPGDVEMMDNPHLLMAQHRGEIEMQPLYTHPTQQGLDAPTLEALQEAESALNSINMGKQHRVVQADGEVTYWQREDWCKWAKDEVLPKVTAALAAQAKQGGV